MSKTLFFHGITVDGSNFTTAGIVDNETLYVGVSVCGNRDHFCKRTGRVRAEGRAKQHDGGRGKYRFPRVVDAKNSIAEFVSFSKGVAALKKKDLFNSFNLNDD
jgi:hypothetical protein